MSENEVDKTIDEINTFLDELDNEEKEIKINFNFNNPYDLRKMKIPVYEPYTKASDLITSLSDLMIKNYIRDVNTRFVSRYITGPMNEELIIIGISSLNTTTSIDYFVYKNLGYLFDSLCDTERHKIITVIRGEINYYVSKIKLEFNKKLKILF